jgi:Xaa-Pro aminopeptidase
MEDHLRRIPSREYPLPFTEQEYADRLGRTRKKMSEMGIDLLFTTWPEGSCYLHGYEVTWWRSSSGPRSWFPATGTAVHVDHDKVIFFAGENSVPSAAKDRRPLSGGGTPEGAAKVFVQELTKDGWLKRGTRVGLEYGSYFPNRRVSQIFEHAVTGQGAKVVDGTDVMRKVQVIKSPAEIAAQEHAARIVDIGHKALAQAFQPGMSHAEVFGEAYYAMFKAGGEWPGLAQGVIPGDPPTLHLLPNRRQIEAGEVFGVDLGGVYKRYHVNVCRTYIYGDPSPELVKLAAASAGAYDVLAKTGKAGTPFRSVTQALRDYYQQQGVWDRRGFLGGYDIGLAFPPDWVGDWLFNVPDEQAEGVLQANMVGQYETIFRQRVGDKPLVVDLIDTYVYGDNGGRRLSAIPMDLIVLG